MSNKARESFDRFIEKFLENPLKNINERVSRGRTVLHYAARLSDPGIVGLLIEEGVNINARDDMGETALHMAAFGGKAENAQVLIDKGAEVNAKSNNQAVPLHLACLARRIETIEVLINAGGDIEAIDKFGCSPLNYAKMYRRVTNFLEKRGINMRDVKVMYDKANEAITEIMVRSSKYLVGKVVNIEDIEQFLIKELAQLKRFKEVSRIIK